MPIFDATTEASWNEFMGGDVPGIAALTLADTIQKRPETVQAFVGALVKAQDFISAHDAAAITEAIYDDYLSAFPKSAIEKTLGVYKQTVFLSDNLITEDAYQRMSAIMGDGRQFSNDELKTVPYSRCVDMSFVRRAGACNDRAGPGRQGVPRAPGRHACGGRGQPDHRRGRVRVHRRPLGLRQEHAAEHDRGLPAAHRRRDPRGRPAGQRPCRPDWAISSRRTRCCPGSASGRTWPWD